MDGPAHPLCDAGDRFRVGVQRIIGKERLAGSPGYRVEMSAPDGPSTGGGKQALQHIKLVPDGGGAVTVAGSANTVEKQAEVRTWEHLQALHAARYRGAELPLDRVRYAELVKKLQAFFAEQGLRVTLARRAARARRRGAASVGGPRRCGSAVAVMAGGRGGALVLPPAQAVSRREPCSRLSVALGAAPSVFLLVFFYLKDRYEPEPRGHVALAFVAGALGDRAGVSGGGGARARGGPRVAGARRAAGAPFEAVVLAGAVEETRQVAGVRALHLPLGRIRRAARRRGLRRGAGARLRHRRERAVRGARRARRRAPARAVRGAGARAVRRGHGLLPRARQARARALAGAPVTARQRRGRIALALRGADRCFTGPTTLRWSSCAARGCTAWSPRCRSRCGSSCCAACTARSTTRRSRPCSNREPIAGVTPEARTPGLGVSLLVLPSVAAIGAEPVRIPHSTDSGRHSRRRRRAAVHRGRAARRRPHGRGAARGRSVERGPRASPAASSRARCPTAKWSRSSAGTCRAVKGCYQLEERAGTVGCGKAIMTLEIDGASGAVADVKIDAPAFQARAARLRLGPRAQRGRSRASPRPRRSSYPFVFVGG